MSTNRTLQLALAKAGIDAVSPLRTTILGTHFLLIGVDATDQIVYRQPLTKEAVISGQALDAAVIPISDYDAAGYPRETSVQLAAQASLLGSRYLRLVSSGFTSILTLDDVEHAVVGWYIIGIDDADEVDTAPYAGNAPEGSTGGGRFGLGAVLDAAAREGMLIDGRMWLQWSCDPASVGATTALPVLFTKLGEGGLRLVQTYWDGSGIWDTLEKTSRILPTASTAALTLDLNGLFDSDPAKSDIKQVLASLGDLMVQRGVALDVGAGFAEGLKVSPLAELPTVYEELLPIQSTLAAGGNLLDNFVVSAGTPNVNTATQFGHTTSWAASHYDGGFPWPSDGRGVKLSLRLTASSHTSSNPDGILVKIAKLVGPSFYEQPAVVELQYFPWSTSPMMYNRIGAYSGITLPRISNQSGTPYGTETSLTFASTSYDLHELYIYPDNRIYVYCNGRFAGELDVPEFLIEPGATYSFGMAVSKCSVTFRDISVEAFHVPVSYTPRALTPKITAVDLSGTRSPSLDPETLRYPATGLLRMDRGQSAYDHVEFNVTATGRLSILGHTAYRGEWELTRIAAGGFQIPYDLTEPFNFTTPVTPLDDWYTFPFDLIAGRYRLKVIGAVESHSMVYLSSLRLDPVLSSTPAITDTWNSQLDVQGASVAKALNPDQLEFEEGVSGVVFPYTSHSTSRSLGFTLTHDTKLRLYIYSSDGALRLHRDGSEPLVLVTGVLTGGQWYEFPYRLPAGRYQLMGAEGTTVMTSWEALQPNDLPDAPEPLVIPEFAQLSTAGNPLTQGVLKATDVLADRVTQDYTRSGEVGLRGIDHILFSVAEESMLSIHSGGVLSAYGLLLDEFVGNAYTTTRTILQPRNKSWHTFTRPLKPGQYRLRGDGNSSGYTYLTEWRLTPVDQHAVPYVPEEPEEPEEFTEPQT